MKAISASDFRPSHRLWLFKTGARPKRKNKKEQSQWVNLMHSSVWHKASEKQLDYKGILLCPLHLYHIDGEQPKHTYWKLFWTKLNSFFEKKNLKYIPCVSVWWACKDLAHCILRWNLKLKKSVFSLNTITNEKVAWKAPHTGLPRKTVSTTTPRSCCSAHFAPLPRLTLRAAELDQ